MLRERFESGQVLKEFRFDPHEGTVIKDFCILESQKEGEMEFLTVGQDQMISWWKFNEPSKNNDQIKPSILGFFFSKPHIQSQAPSNEQGKLNTPTLLLSKFLNEPDRCIDRILTASGNLALLEDSTHGRLLLLDTEHALIIKTFKGYRNCSAVMNKRGGGLLIWSGNRFTLEEWTDSPFGDSRRSLIDEAVDSLASFDSNGSFFMFSKKSHQLKLYTE